MDLDLELGTENFTPAMSRLWHIASPGQEIEKKTLNHLQVVDMFCLTIRDLETLQKGRVAEFCFRHGNKSLLLASEQLVLIWNSFACYISYGDVSSKRFQDFLIAAKAWVSSGLPIDNSLVIRAALHLVYEGVQDQVQKLKSGVEDALWFPDTLRDLGEKGSLLSSESKKVIAEVFDSGSPGEVRGVAVFLEPNQLQEYEKAWDSILEQLDTIRALFNTKLRNLKIIMALYFALWVAFGAGVLGAVLLLVVVKPISVFTILYCVLSFVLVFYFVYPQLREIKNKARIIWVA